MTEDRLAAIRRRAARKARATTKARGLAADPMNNRPDPKANAKVLTSTNGSLKRTG